MRILTTVSIFVLLALILSACGGAAPAPTAAPAAQAQPTAAPAAAQPTQAPAAPAAAAGGELKVAILAPLTGSQPTFGVSTRDGALLAIEDYAKAHNGGPLGMKITPIVEDSQCSPDPAVNAANKVIDQDKVHYIVGEVCSSASIPVSEIANAKHVVQISPTSTNPSVTVGTDGKTKDYIFRACFIDPFQGTVGANFALNTLKAKKAFIMADQSNDYVKGLAEFFEQAFTKGGGQIVGKENYNGKTDTDFSAILSKVAAASPDLVYLPDYYQTVNLVTKQAKDKGINVPFMGGDGWDSSDLDVKSAAGGYFTNHYAATDPRPEVQNFVNGYKAKYGSTPDALAALAYDATMILQTSIDKAGADDATKVKDAMASGTFNEVSGKITFDPQHNPVKSAVIMAVTADGVKYNSTVAP